MPFVAVRESLHENDNSKRTDNVGFLGDCVAQLGRFRLRGFYEF
jgi:hypothetical protein